MLAAQALLEMQAELGSERRPMLFLSFSLGSLSCFLIFTFSRYQVLLGNAHWSSSA